MSKTWLTLIIIAIVTTAVLISWDIFATFTGYKSDLSFSINPIEERLFGNIEDHFRSSPDFSEVVSDSFN